MRSTAQYIVQRARQKGLTPRVNPPSADTAALQEIIERLRSELDKTRLERDEAHASLRISTRPKFTVRHDYGIKPEYARVLVIGDAHDDPKIPDKSRFYWAGRYCADNKISTVISIGDFLNLNSLCFHVPDETFGGKAKPTFMADIQSGKLAFEAFNRGLGDWKPEKHLVLGNHENRLYRAEDKQPASWGMYRALFDEIVTGAGFTYSPYGAPHVVSGVIFSHIPLTVMGKPSSARHLNAIGNDSIDDAVYGHSHRARCVSFPKLFSKSVTVVDAGCFLPHGYKSEEEFAEHTPGDWAYGLTDLGIRNGRIADYKFVSALSLEETYGTQD